VKEENSFLEVQEESPPPWMWVLKLTASLTHIPNL